MFCTSICWIKWYLQLYRLVHPIPVITFPSIYIPDNIGYSPTCTAMCTCQTLIFVLFIRDIWPQVSCVLHHICNVKIFCSPVSSMLSCLMASPPRPLFNIQKPSSYIYITFNTKKIHFQVKTWLLFIHPCPGDLDVRYFLSLNLQNLNVLTMLI